ncbi:MAG TPA: hypothetical protein VFV38_07210 [Ktedonobacteraceae bacterium]|nr:hypothetical protein [Ktedonobacteraceae bacterium]
MSRDQAKSPGLSRQQGYARSATQLVRWYRAGLLPRPQQHPLKDAEALARSIRLEQANRCSCSACCARVNAASLTWAGSCS